MVLITLTAFVVLLCSAAPSASSQLRLVAQLNVRGCTLFVHDSGASGGPHLVLEPIVCLMTSLEDLCPKRDPITSQLYVSIPVLISDTGMLEAARSQLLYLAPKSVSFATVNDIRVDITNSSTPEVIWSPDESVAVLRLQIVGNDTSTRFITGYAKNLVSRAVVSASVILNGTCHNLDYNLIAQSPSLVNPELYSLRRNLPPCRPLRFRRSINFDNCTARVHQRLDVKGHFLIEPLMCHNISSMSNQSVEYDNIRGVHYVKLDVVLHDDAALHAVRTDLADLSPLSVEFMRLQSAQSILSSGFSARFSVSPLMVSVDWRSAQLRLFCGIRAACDRLSSDIRSEPVNLWRHLKWNVTYSRADECVAIVAQSRYMWRMKEVKPTVSCPKILWPVSVPSRIVPTRNPAYVHQQRNGRNFVVIQQRTSGGISFQRTWREYETGFGDRTNFWIGLSAIHSLSRAGTTLRVEMRLWTGSALHAEYAGFQVGSAGTKYLMTYREMLRAKSNVSVDAMAHHRGMRFSTMDRDNDEYRSSCSNMWGKGGWWFNACHHFNPNGLYPSRMTSDTKYMQWHSGSSYLPLREVRLLIQH